jgi:hypothetical protein
MKVFALLFLSLPSLAQVHVSLSPDVGYRLSGYGKTGTVWTVTACVRTASSPAVVIRGGDVYGMLNSRHVSWITQTQAVAMLQQAPAKSLAGRAVTYLGYASAIGAVLLGTNTVKANVKWTAALTTGSGALNVGVPLVTKAEPAVPVEVQSGLLGPFMVVPAGNCAAAFVLGGPGTPFEGDL